jgi:hypothetical protein
MAGPSDLSAPTAQAIERLGRAVSLGPPPLIEGEDAPAYYQLRDRIAAAVKPRDILEEIWVRDIADLSWEVLRLRRLKARYLTAQVAAQIRGYLKGPCGTSQAQKLSVEWEAGDPRVSARVDELLATSDSPTVESITAQVFLGLSEHFERIDRMTMNAEARRNAALRENERHRSSVAQALLRASEEEVVEAEFEDVKPDKRAQKDAA